VLALTHSAAKAGFVAFARFLPVVLLGLPAGLAADRLDRKRVMITADGVRALAVGGLAVLVAFDPVFWPIPLIAFVEGSGEAFFSASQGGALRAVVPPEQLAAAVSVQQGRVATVGLAGPPAGGFLFALGRAVPFAADAASYAFSFGSLALMRTPFQQPREPRTATLRTELADGFRFVWRQPFLRITTFLYGIGNFTIPGVIFTLVVVARRHGLGSAEIGLLLAAFSACLLLGAVASGAVRARLSARAIILLELGLGMLTLVYVAVPDVYVLAAALLPLGLVLPITDSVVITRRLQITPDAMLGRVESARATIARAAAPLGPLVAGILLTVASGRATIAVFALCSLALAAWGTFSRALRS
jgi:MFS family permease